MSLEHFFLFKKENGGKKKPFYVISRSKEIFFFFEFKRKWNLMWFTIALNLHLIGLSKIADLLGLVKSFSSG